MDKQSHLYVICLVCFFYATVVHAQKESNQFTVKGYAFSAGPGEQSSPLPGAEVIAWDKDSVAQLMGIAEENGYFECSIPKRPVKIEIRYLGYTPYEADYPANNRLNILSLDTCYLSADLTLDEIVVSGTNVDRATEADTYLVTNGMRTKATNTYDLLDQLHGVRYDKMTNTIRVGNESKVLLLVDGMEQSKEYIASINPERIARIEVSKQPKGRYQSEGYEAVINLKLKTDYQGYDITVQNMALLNAAGNEDDWLMSDQPSFQTVYTNRTLNLFANYTFGHAAWNTPVARKVVYSDRLLLEPEAGLSDEPNDLYAYKAHLVHAGLNYKVNPAHTISFTGNYMYERTKLDDLFAYTIHDRKKDVVYKQLNTTTNITSYDDYTATLFYKGTAAGDKLDMYSDLSYNYYANDASNAFARDQSLLSLSTYREKRNYIQFTTDMEYKLSDLFTLKFGYSYGFRRYDAHLTSGEEVLNYRERKNKGYAYLQFSPSQKLGIEIGTGAEGLRIQQSSASHHYLQFLPVFQLNYQPSSTLNLKASYLTSMEYPSIYELNPVSSAIDSLMVLKGNPALQAAVRHTFSFDLSLWNKLTFTPQFRYTPHAIGQLVEPSGASYLTTFRNVKLKGYAFQLMYDQPAGEYVNWSNNLTYYSDKAAYGKEAHRVNGWLFESEVSYFNPAWGLMAQGGYYRSMRKQATVQGYGMEDLDSWGVSVSKKFLRNRLSVMLVYFAPLEWGMRKEQEKVTRTPYFQEVYTTSLKPYRNMCLIRISFRFGRGKVNFLNKHTEIEKDQRIRRTVEF